MPRVRYCKVPYRKVGDVSRDAIVKEVQDALPDGIDASVDEGFFGFPCINFSESVSTEEMMTVRQILVSQGFEVS